MEDGRDYFLPYLPSWPKSVRPMNQDFGPMNSSSSMAILSCRGKSHYRQSHQNNIIYLPLKFVFPVTWSQPGNLPGPHTHPGPPATLNSLEEKTPSEDCDTPHLPALTCVVEEKTSLQWLDPVIRAHSGRDCGGGRGGGWIPGGSGGGRCWVPCSSSWSNADMIDDEETAMKTVIKGLFVIDQLFSLPKC